MPKIKVESKYLSEEDIPDGDLIATITDVQKQTVGQGEKAQQKWILFFKEQKKGLVLNSTNIKTLTTLFHSDDSDDWMGQKIAVWYNPDVEMMGEIVGGLRIRAKLPAGAAKKPVGDKYAIDALVTKLHVAESTKEVMGLIREIALAECSDEDREAMNVLADQRMDELKRASQA
jgi:hypothetical protein